MPDSSTTSSFFRELASGQRRGLWPSLLRGALGLAEVPYTGYMRRRNVRYDAGRLKVERVPVPVVSVGNLTTGGTGKTPFVEWLARWWQARGVRVGIVSRGYGAKPGAPNDETRELSQNLPDVPHVQNPDRVAGAREAIDSHKCELVLLDDGFQHRRVHRDLDIVLLDALEPFGYRHLLPRGLLREPIASLARAHVVCLSRSDLIDAPQRAALRAEVHSHAPHAVWVELAHGPRSLLSHSGEEAHLDSLRGRRVAAFCGLGNPAGFRQTLARLECEVVAWREYPDHFRYEPAEVIALEKWLAPTNSQAILCTHKDLVKINADQLTGKPLWAVRVGIDVLSGLEGLEQALHSLG